MHLSIEKRDGISARQHKGRLFPTSISVYWSDRRRATSRWKWLQIQIYSMPFTLGRCRSDYIYHTHIAGSAPEVGRILVNMDFGRHFHLQWRIWRVLVVLVDTMHHHSSVAQHRRHNRSNFVLPVTRSQLIVAALAY